MFVDLCRAFRAGAVRNGPVPNFARKAAQNRPKLKLRFLVPYKVGGTNDRVIDFGCLWRAEKGDEMAFAFFSGADSRCVLYHLSRRARLVGSWGPILAGKRPNDEN